MSAVSAVSLALGIEINEYVRVRSMNPDEFIEKAAASVRGELAHCRGDGDFDVEQWVETTTADALANDTWLQCFTDWNEWCVDDRVRFAGLVQYLY